jgi:DDE superfamily endonuclease
VTSVHDRAAGAGPLAELTGFRQELYRCFTKRGDALMGLADAMLCKAGPVDSPVELCMEPEFGRGHGSVFDCLNGGRIDFAALRAAQIAVLPPPLPGEPMMFAIDQTPLARPDAVYADQMTMVQVRGKGGDKFLPGWKYSIVVGLHWGASSWVDPVEARRLLPGDDDTQVTVAQVNDLLDGLAAAGQRKSGNPPPLICLDSGNNSTAITHALQARDVQLVIRLKSNRRFRGRPGPRMPGQRGPAKRHGGRLELKAGGQRPAPDLRLARQSDRYGQVEITAWRHMHQELDRSGPFKDWPEGQDLPAVEGTVVRMKAEHLPGGRKASKDMWLWLAGPAEPDAGLIDLAWKAYLRRFDQEHYHRFSKVYLGMDRAHLTSAQATDRWVALALAACTQLRLAAPLVPGSSRPWHKKLQAGQVPSPYRTRLGFPRLGPQLGTPAKPAKSVKPGPGRPEGSRNRPKNRQPVHRKASAKPVKASSAADQAP